MISRRLLRVKVLQMLYAFYKNDDRSLAKAEKELLFSIGKAYDLYHYLLLLLVDVAFIAEKKIEAGRNKLVPNPVDIHPNTRFIENKLLKLLADNVQLKSYVETNCISWADQEGFVNGLYKTITESDLYSKYMNAENNDFAADKKFVEKIFMNILARDENFYSLMEDKSIYWNDEIEFILSMVVRTIKQFKEGDNEHVSLMSLFKDSDDEEFVKVLFRKTILKHDENLVLIKENTKNWDLERIAFMDILILEMSLTEIQEFNSIPVKASFNEYLEIAKYYSTENSSTFINGLLDKMIKDLQKEGKINKIGRGLIEQSKTVKS